jgi:hypothetical protein
MFVVKARSLPQREATFTRNFSRLERLTNNKDSSLLDPFINYEDTCVN